MKEIELRYSYKKIILAVVFTVLMIVFFLHLNINANKLSLISPNKSSTIHGWVGYLFYKNETLLFIISLLFIFLFSYMLITLIRLFLKKGLVVKKEFNTIYFNNKKIESLKNIKYLERVGKNFIYFHFTEKIKRNSFSFKKSKYAFNVSLFEKKPDEIYFLIKSLIDKKG